jgi:hypothetical protein
MKTLKHNGKIEIYRTDNEVLTILPLIVNNPILISPHLRLALFPSIRTMVYRVGRPRRSLTVDIAGERYPVIISIGSLEQYL